MGMFLLTLERIYVMNYKRNVQNITMITTVTAIVITVIITDVWY